MRKDDMEYKVHLERHSMGCQVGRMAVSFLGVGAGSRVRVLAERPDLNMELQSSETEQAADEMEESPVRLAGMHQKSYSIPSAVMLD